MAIELKQNSRGNWTTDNPGNDEKIQLGALLRIADAVEAMSAYHVALIKDRDLYQKWYREEQNKTDALQNKIRALKGVITKQKARISQLTPPPADTDSGAEQ